MPPTGVVMCMTCTSQVGYDFSLQLPRKARIAMGEEAESTTAVRMVQVLS